jgi:hypothetical protein
MKIEPGNDLFVRERNMIWKFSFQERQQMKGEFYFLERKEIKSGKFCSLERKKG